MVLAVLFWPCEHLSPFEYHEQSCTYVSAPSASFCNIQTGGASACKTQHFCRLSPTKTMCMHENLMWLMWLGKVLVVVLVVSGLLVAVLLRATPYDGHASDGMHQSNHEQVCTRWLPFSGCPALRLQHPDGTSNDPTTTNYSPQIASRLSVFRVSNLLSFVCGS